MGRIIKNGVPYGGSGNKAQNISYDNSGSGLNAGNVQAAVDELTNVVDESIQEALGGYKIRVLSESEYANLGTYDATTIYYCYKD